MGGGVYAHRHTHGGPPRPHLIVQCGRAHVDYHLISFPGRFAVISVRGSTTPWEWLTDAQLWSGAAVSGFIRSFLPFGAIWTPIIDNLLKAISIVESESLDKVSLYQQTTSFVEVLEQSGNYDKLHITGHSLGGGIALITGAQTRIPAIAMSGPNAMLSRKTFDPEITPEAINEFLFNVIPERDIIPRIDDVGMLSQNIKCRANKNDLWGCHSSIRTLCEISYTCGSFTRPPLCDCATKYGE
jgi:lipase ATG15